MPRGQSPGCLHWGLSGIQDPTLPPVRQPIAQEQYRGPENSKQSFKPEAAEQATGWMPSWRDAWLRANTPDFCVTRA